MAYLTSICLYFVYLKMHNFLAIGILESVDPGPGLWTKKCWTLGGDFDPKKVGVKITLPYSNSSRSASFLNLGSALF